jgi:hypothetical protein
MKTSNREGVQAIKVAAVAKSGEYNYIANTMRHGRNVTTLTIFLEKSVPY